MCSKTGFSLFITGIFLFGFVILSLPQSASAGAPLGCCINNSGNCAGGCGVEASNCTTEKLGSCPREDISEEQCNGNLGGPGSDNVRCFVEGSVCNQTTNTKGACGPGGETPQCEIAEEDCPDPSSECVEAVCNNGNCAEVPVDGASENPNCNPPPAAPTAIIPTMGQWGMLLAAVVLGIFAIIRLRSIKDFELS